MKKSTLIIGGVLAGLTLGALVVAAVMVGTEDFGEKITYFQSAFEVDKPYFDSCPNDQELKELFNKHKKGFHQLAIMVHEDNVNTFNKNWIFHNDKNFSMTFCPYRMGEFPPDKIISREKFFKYLDFLKSCKIQDISSDYEEQKSESNPNAISESGSKGFKFNVFEDSIYDNVPEGKYISLTKSIYYFENDNDFKVVPNTDVLKELGKGEKSVVFARLEPHWCIKKAYVFESDAPSTDSNDVTESNNTDTDIDAEK